MTDIVERLRSVTAIGGYGDLFAQAADEIEALRADKSSILRQFSQRGETIGRFADEIERLRKALAEIRSVVERDGEAVMNDDEQAIWTAVHYALTT